MSFIYGSVKRIIYESNSYKVGIFKVKESDDVELNEYVGHSISFVGNFNNLNNELLYKFYGNLVNNPKYGVQYSVESYEVVNPTNNEEMTNYLGSGLFEGIGLKLAKRIVDKFKDNTFEIIKTSPMTLTTVNGISLKKAEYISNKFNNLTEDDRLIKDLTTMGFSVNESVKIIKNYKYELEGIIKNNLYKLIDIIDFDKVDNIYKKYNDENSDLRIEYVIKHSIKSICYKYGNSLASREGVYLEVIKYFNNDFKINSFNLYIENLITNGIIYEFNDYLMLDYFYEIEKKIKDTIHIYSKIKNSISEKELNKHIKYVEKTNNIKLNIEQINAIKGSLINNLFIISGGPGTGKTTIIKSIVDYYENKDNIALLAPTGRSAKRMSESVNLGASTIHKFLKWNKEDGTFGLNINNKSKAKIVIIDEFSMVDMFLFSSLIDALNVNIKLILVGDANQLPSIGPGNLLFDLLNSETLKKQYLSYIYRTNEKSYINILADNVKNCKEFNNEKTYNDFKFIESKDDLIISHIKNICSKILDKDLSLDETQVLVPMYKGINGLDNINNVMQNIFNPYNDMKKEIVINNTIFREGDKVMNLVNDVDANVYNGDIGYIKKIYVSYKKVMEIDFSGNIVKYESDSFDKIALAYAISIHKSQGSEYDNVILILANAHKRMFYNKLIYTAITRPKKSLVIIGSIDNFNYSIKLKENIKRITHLNNIL